MIALLPAVPLPISILIIFILKWVNRKPGSIWLAGFLGSLISWILMIAFRPLWANQVVDLPELSGSLYVEKLRLLLDPVSWTFSFAVISILIASFFAYSNSGSLNKQDSVQWHTLTGLFFYTILILLASCSGNLLTLLFWSGFLLIIEFILRLRYQITKKEYSQAFISPFGRLLILAIIFLAMVLAKQPGFESGFQHLDPLITNLILIAGIMPALIPLFKSSPDSLRELSVPLLNTTSFIPILVLLNRTAALENTRTALTLPLVLLCAVGLNAGLRWYVSVDTDHFNDWAAFAAVFCTACAMTAQPAACLAWSTAFIFGGFIINQQIISAVIRKPLRWIVVFSLSSLPFSPTWAGSLLYSSAKPIWIPFMAAQGILQLCYLTSSNSKRIVQSWESFQKPIFLVIGYFLILVSWFGLSIWNLMIQPEVLQSLLQPANFLAGLLVIGFWILFLIADYFFRIQANRAAGSITRILRQPWLSNILLRLLFWFGKLTTLINTFLESQAGLLWALLILALIFTFFGQQTGGS